MRTHFYNAKVNNVWQEVYINGDRGDKKEALKIFNKFDKNIKLKDVYSAINVPSGCPDTFNKSLNELL